MSKVRHPYPVVIYPCMEGGFVAEILSLPGCLAQGETLEECMAELDVVADLWIETAHRENRMVPTPEMAIEQMRAWRTIG